jgi:type IV pilus assembly protein PilN
MIRVNLLSADRPAGKKAKVPSAPGAVQLYLFLAVFVGGAIVLSALLFVYVNRQIADLDAKIVDRNKRLSDLQAVKKQVDEFQAKKKTLEDKVNLIERLRAEQAGPVHMLDEISKALPDFVWLTSMDQNGANLSMKGQTSGLTAVADFIANLQRSGWFPSVELKSTTEANNVVTFEVGAVFKDPAIAARDAANPTPAPAGKGKAKGKR